MSDDGNRPFRISAKYIGPIFSMDGELTKRAQNLIFARNGTGKSFISRAFRCLDLYGQEIDVLEFAEKLVSEESENGLGEFQFFRGTNQLGKLSLNANGPVVDVEIGNTIFHVFSEDFVHEELREKKFELDSEIKNEISIGSENIKLNSAQKEYDEIQKNLNDELNSLEIIFGTKKESELKAKTGINAQLNEYKNLTFENLVSLHSEKPTKPAPDFKGILSDLETLKALPVEIDSPDELQLVSVDASDLSGVSDSLLKLTSAASVADKIKEKIDAQNDFIRAGTDLVTEKHLSNCPFCDQDITTGNPKELIDSYVAYFEDEEEKHKVELRQYYSSLKSQNDKLSAIEASLNSQISKFENLKSYLPSQKNIDLDNCADVISKAQDSISSVLEIIETKAKNLAVPQSLADQTLELSVGELNKRNEKNNEKVRSLVSTAKAADEERRNLQRRGCEIFGTEFVADHWRELEQIKLHRNSAETKLLEIKALEKSAPSARARDRVAATFEMLLKEFFGDKYKFEESDFTLKRGDRPMGRGPYRTLSDGEKSALAFCYFIASIHKNKKVTSNSDYADIFLVFDDPVTSMSHDFIFSIAQTLKHLTLSDQGEISIDPSRIGQAGHFRPEILVLTHNAYFFNVARVNRVVRTQSAFSLHQKNDVHEVSTLNKYVAPFEDQLREVYQVANGTGPAHTVGNSIRSVLEAVGRFCRPDKEGVTKFLTHVAAEDKIVIKSVMISNLSHGSFLEETPSPEDIELACQEALKIVEKYAPGQLELVKAE